MEQVQFSLFRFLMLERTFPLLLESFFVVFIFFYHSNCPTDFSHPVFKIAALSPCASLLLLLLLLIVLFCFFASRLTLMGLIRKTHLVLEKQKEQKTFLIHSSLRVIALPLVLIFHLNINILYNALFFVFLPPPKGPPL